MNNTESDFADILGSEDERLIMSEGLSLDLGVDLVVEQILTINNVKYICMLRKASFNKNTWEFDLEVPGVSLSDLVDIETMIFAHGDSKFLAYESFELINQDIIGPVITFKAKRIFNNNE